MVVDLDRTSAHAKPLSVPDAARALGVTPARVRAMIEAGLLAAVKVGGRWLVDGQSVTRRARVVAPVGRPFSAKRAWGLLLLAAGRRPDWLSASDVCRLRARLNRPGLVALVPRLRGRAAPCVYRAHPSDLPRLARERGVVRAGISSTTDHGLDLVAPGLLDLYIPSERLATIERTFALQVASPADANLQLRLVDTIWPFGQGEEYAPDAVVGVDLAESGDARTRRAGLELLEKVQRRWLT